MSAPHLFRIWRSTDNEHDESPNTARAYLPVSAAEEYADRFHAARGWESDWPITFFVRDLGEHGRDDAGVVWKVAIEREMVPSFYAEKRTADQVAPGIHDRRAADGADVCPCAHPFAHADTCARCICHTGKRFFQAEDGGAIYWFCAADAPGCKQILVAGEVELEDQDGNYFLAHLEPEKIDAALTFEEIEQHQATKLKQQTADVRGEIRLIDANLGEWFTSDY